MKPQPQPYTKPEISGILTFTLTSMFLAIDPSSKFTVLLGAEKLVFHEVEEFGLREPRGKAVPMVRKVLRKEQAGKEENHSKPGCCLYPYCLSHVYSARRKKGKEGKENLIE